MKNRVKTEAVKEGEERVFLNYHPNLPGYGFFGCFCINFDSFIFAILEIKAQSSYMLGKGTK